MITTFVVLFVIYVFVFLFSPFPYWKTYFVLWYRVLFCRKSATYGISKGKQISFLLRYALLSPLWTFLWYLDELLFPAYKNREVKPVFIIGQARSGTTFLHRTLAADEENFIAIRHIEWRYPYIFVQKLLSQSRWLTERFCANYWPNTETGRLAAKMHPNSLLDWEEDGVFFEERFLHHLFLFMRFPYPDLVRYLDDYHLLPEKIQERMLKTHKKVIQKMIYLRKGDNKFYLSKEVAGHNKVEKMMALYPNSKFVVSVRKSSGFLSSLIELIRFSTKVKTNVDPINIPGWEEAFVGRMRNDCLLLVDLCDNIINKKNPIYVSFKQNTSDVVRSVERVYQQLGCQIGEEFQKYIINLSSTQKEREKGYAYEKKVYEGFERFDEFVIRTEKRL